MLLGYTPYEKAREILGDDLFGFQQIRTAKPDISDEEFDRIRNSIEVRIHFYSNHLGKDEEYIQYMLPLAECQIRRAKDRSARVVLYDSKIMKGLPKVAGTCWVVVPRHMFDPQNLELKSSQ